MRVQTRDGPETMWRATTPRTLPESGARGLFVLLMVNTVAATWMATQYAAWVWQDYPALGSPLITVTPGYARYAMLAAELTGGGALVLLHQFVRKTHQRRATGWGTLGFVGLTSLLLYSQHHALYAPHQVLVWALRYRHVPPATHTLHAAFVVWCVTMGAGTVMTLVCRGRRSQRQPSDAHGTARWGTGETLRHTEGLLLGRLGDTPLRYRGDGHLVTVAPTRSGKGVSVIIPNLLTYPGSVVVTDPKGENYAVTARRRRELGTEVVAFDPFDVVGGTAAFNPLAMIDATTSDAVDDARLIADMLVVVDGKETGEQAFWNEEARALLAGLVLYVIAEAPPELRHLPHIRTLLTLPPALFAELLTRMSASDAVGGLVARAAHRVLQKAEKERSGVISSAQSHTHFLDSPRMTAVLSHSTVDVGQLKHTPTSIFLILPPDRLESYHRYLRLMLATCLHVVTRTLEPPVPSVGRIVFLIDEFGHLGRLRPIEQQVGLIGGYGASLWLFVQDLSQLKAVYAERWATFLANADVLQMFGTNDWDTAEYVSKMTGEATVFTDSENRSRGVSYGKHGSRQVSTAATLAERGRRLLLPDEVRRLPRTTQVLFVKHSHPILAFRLTHLPPHDRVSSALFAGHFDPNPMTPNPATVDHAA